MLTRTADRKNQSDLPTMQLAVHAPPCPVSREAVIHERLIGVRPTRPAPGFSRRITESAIRKSPCEDNLGRTDVSARGCNLAAELFLSGRPTSARGVPGSLAARCFPPWLNSTMGRPISLGWKNRCGPARHGMRDRDVRIPMFRRAWTTVSRYRSPGFHIRRIQPGMQIAQRLATSHQFGLVALPLEAEDLE